MLYPKVSIGTHKYKKNNTKKYQNVLKCTTYYQQVPQKSPKSTPKVP